MYNANKSHDDIYILIKNIKDSSDEKEDKIKQFEEHLEQDNTMLNEYPNPNIKFEFVDKLYGLINRVYTGNTDHEDKCHLDDIVTRIFPDEEMGGGKKPRKTKKSRKTKKAKKSRKAKKAKKAKKSRKTRKTRKTKKRTKRGGTRTRRNPTPTEKGKAFKADQALKKTKRETAQTINKLTKLVQDITLAPVLEQIGPK